MKRLFYLIIALCIAIPMQAKSSRNNRTEINVGTFNVWGNRQRNSMVYKYKKAPESRLWEHSQPDMPYSQIIRTHFTDTRNIAKHRSKMAGTMNGAEARTTPPTHTLDYIYIRGNELKYKVLSHNVLLNRYKVGDSRFYPSDHCPVSARIRLSK
ncbi:MAG: hypothetical protein IIV16_03785 [Alistipes sp.]|nr:hypothetical protein [Alistipes sp.]